MIIKRGALFITIALLMLFPWHVFGASSKNLAKKKNPVVSKEVTQKKSASAKIRAHKNSKQSLTAQKKRTKKSARKRYSRQVAHENPVNTPQDAPL